MLEVSSLPPSSITALEIFRRNNGQLRSSEALRLGIHSKTLYRLRDTGVLTQIERGLYRLTDLPPLSNPDLVTVASKIPHAVICLISALAFHNLTDQVPHGVDIAIEGHAERPRLTQPPIRVFWYSSQNLTAGVEVYQIDGVAVKIFGPEKTIADAFKYRHKIGPDVALAALKVYRRRRRFDVSQLLQYARLCRVENIMRPYLETLL